MRDARAAVDAIGEADAFLSFEPGQSCELSGCCSDPMPGCMTATLALVFLSLGHLWRSPERHWARGARRVWVGAEEGLTPAGVCSVNTEPFASAGEARPEPNQPRKYFAEFPSGLSGNQSVQHP